MTKNEILEITKRERKRQTSRYWCRVVAGVARLNCAVTLKGMARYIAACQEMNVQLDANAFIEILDDARNGVQVWTMIDDDERFVPGQRNRGSMKIASNGDTATSGYNARPVRADNKPVNLV
jgi:hypothetical protein